MKHTQARLAHEIRERIETVTQFGAGDFPDGLAFDEEGHAWVVSIVSNRLIRVAPDGSYARIYWGTLGPVAAAKEAIEKAKPYLRRCLAAELQIRRVPELDFRLDETLARAERVEGVLRELEQERAAKQKKEEPA